LDADTGKARPLEGVVMLQRSPQPQK